MTHCFSVVLYSSKSLLFRINIRVYGRTDIKAGQTITYKTPKTGEIVKKEIDTAADSEYFTGKYLITDYKAYYCGWSTQDGYGNRF